MLVTEGRAPFISDRGASIRLQICHVGPPTPETYASLSVAASCEILWPCFATGSTAHSA
jgi:hypothetical protein